MASNSIVPVVKSGTQSIFGSGDNKIIIKVAQDFYLNDAQFKVIVDGEQVGDIYTVTATNNSQTNDQFTLYGDWGAGKHDIQIVYLNDAYNAKTGQDANLKIASVTYDGVAALSGPAYLFGNGGKSMSVDGGSASGAIKTINGTAGADVLTGKSINEIIAGGRGNDTLTGGGGRDIFVHNRGDGKDTITDFKATGSGADVLRVSGYMIADFDQLKKHMVQSGANTVIELSANNYAILKDVKMTDLTAANFEFLNPVAIRSAVNQTIGTGSNQLVLKLTQDFYEGADAKFTVAVDGVQVGGTYSVSSVRMTGQQDMLTINGDWAAGSHKVTVTFLNDAFNATTLEDRNLRIEGASINGTNIANVAYTQGTNGSYSFNATVPAPIVSAPVVTQPPVAVIPPAVEVKPTLPTLPIDVTHDLISFVKGTGTKVITGFSATGQGADMLRLGDFGLLNKAATASSISSFDQLKSLMSQSGSDTVIKLSATDIVTLKDVKMTDLTASNFSFMSKLDGSMQAVEKNGWIVFNNTWGSTDFTYGKDYKMTATYDANAMTTGTTFTWDYGAPRYDYTKVLGYPSVMFGFDTFGNAGYTSDRSMTLPVQINKLDALTSKFDVNWGGEKAGYDVAYDIWLTNKPNGIWSDITNEVMIWLHKGDMGIWGNLVGTYSDGNYSAKIYHIGTYTALVPDKDYTAGEIDIADVLKKLVSLGIVSTSEYVNQIDLGAEPWKGSGSLTINSLDISVESHDASGIVSKNYADGGATEVQKIGTAKADILSADGALIASLKGGAGNDTFQFTKGKTGALTVEDFHAYTSASAEHDLLKFVGYGSGATLVHDAGDAWSIHYSGGVDHIMLKDVASLSASDYIFV